MIQFRKAERKKAKLRLAVDGPSGSGKTYSALLIAKGLGGRTAVIDTECGSASLYATVFDFDVLELAPPFHPDRYVEAIKAAEQAGYDNIIIDSLSHAWSGEGGLLEIVDMWAKKKRNGMEAWKEATPIQNRLVQSILQSRCHVIAGIRSKTAWDMERDGKTGKVTPKKVGLAPEQRGGIEYEFTVVLDLSIDGHIATASKDRTGIFDGTPFVPSEKTGRALMAWLSSGAEARADEAEPVAEQRQQQQKSEPMTNGLKAEFDAARGAWSRKLGTKGWDMAYASAYAWAAGNNAVLVKAIVAICEALDQGADYAAVKVEVRNAKTGDLADLRRCVSYAVAGRPPEDDMPPLDEGELDYMDSRN